VRKARDIPAVYRIRLHEQEPQAVIYFSPLDPHLVSNFYSPFYDPFDLVTPVYWGAYVPERRAHRIIVEGFSLTVEIKTTAACIHPVFELVGAPKDLGRSQIERWPCEGQPMRLGRPNTVA
jgi:hypothetical protein